MLCFGPLRKEGTAGKGEAPRDSEERPTPGKRMIPSPRALTTSVFARVLMRRVSIRCTFEDTSSGVLVGRGKTGSLKDSVRLSHQLASKWKLKVGISANEMVQTP